MSEDYSKTIERQKAFSVLLSEMNPNSNQNCIKRRFKKFSVQTYRQILKAWTITTGNPTTDSTDSSDHFNNNLEAIDNKTDVTLKDTIKTIDLNDSLESIPETPEFVEKRKSMKTKKNTKVNKRYILTINMFQIELRTHLCYYSLISEFIDFEAEVVMDSKDSFCDDIENTQKEVENSSQSIINDIIPMDTQPIGQLIGGIDSRSAEDMQTVYLRSVKEDIIGNTHKYKLQYNYDPTIDVFSQEPNESDLEDYELDSFCVPNDIIEYDEPSPQTATKTIEIIY